MRASVDIYRVMRWCPQCCKVMVAACSQAQGEQRLVYPSCGIEVEFDPSAQVEVATELGSRWLH